MFERNSCYLRTYWLATELTNILTNNSLEIVSKRFSKRKRKKFSAEVEAFQVLKQIDEVLLENLFFASIFLVFISHVSRQFQKLETLRK